MKDIKLMKTERVATEHMVAAGDHPFISFMPFMVKKTSI